MFKVCHFGDGPWAMAVRFLFCRDSATMQSFHMKFLHLLQINDIIIILMNFCVLGTWKVWGWRPKNLLQWNSDLHFKLVMIWVASFVADAAKQLTGFNSPSST